MPATLQTAMVVADVSTGEVQALVGDRYPGRAGFNRAIHARRQIGSVIKPLVYLLALEHSERLQPGHRIEDEPLTLNRRMEVTGLRQIMIASRMERSVCWKH